MTTDKPSEAERLADKTRTLIAKLREMQRPGAERDLTVMCADAADEIERLREKNEALRADAARYLAITGDGFSESILSNFYHFYDRWDGCDGKVRFDAVIDAAIAAQQEQT